MKIKKYFSLPFLLPTLLLSCVASAPMLLAENKQQETPKPLTPEVLQAAVPYFKPLLTLEETPPAGSLSPEEWANSWDDTKSIALPIYGGLMESLLNSLASQKDYFSLYTAKVASVIDDNVTSDNAGNTYHHFVCKKGQRNTLLGYLSCFDISNAESVANAVANQDGATNYSSQVYNSYTLEQDPSFAGKKHHKLLFLNLGYDYLSPEAIAALEGTYKPSNSENYLVIKNVGYPNGHNAAGLTQNCYSFSLGIAFHDRKSEETQWGSSYDIFGKNDPASNYTK